MKKLLLIGLGVVLLAGLGAGGYWFWQQRRIDSFAQTPFGEATEKTVVIPAGSGPRTVANLLEKAGVVQDAELLYRWIRKEQLGPKLRAGEYAFTGPLSPKEALGKVLRGEVKVYRFTVPEGLRVDEILPILARSDLKLDLAKLTKLAQDEAFVRKLGVPAARLEGFLYPDTYTFTRGADEQAVLSKMVKRALEEYENAEAVRRPGNKLNLLQTMTLASIVEKETGAVQERPRIACVFHNRLRLGMKLQTDPTVLYAMSLLRGRWLNNITRKDLETDHPYSTYARTGLPPGPIANPGKEAIRAALNPLECDDLYFVSRNDGTHVFCPTLECHNAAVEKWQRAFFRQAKKAKGKAQKSTNRTKASPKR